MSDSAFNEKRKALLVGINLYYLDESIGNLRYCVNDVKSLNEILINPLRGNFDTYLLTSDVTEKINEPNRSNIMSMIKLISNNASPDDTILFYFAGHGMEKDGKSYILPADSKMNILDETAISIDWIKDVFNKTLAKRRILVLDSCHSGSNLGRMAGRMTEEFERSLLENSEGIAIFCSCKAGQQACELPDMEHGIFSYYLLEGLMGKADSKSKGFIFLSDINQYVTTKLNEWGLINRIEQKPTLQLDVSGDIFLVKVPTEASQNLPAQFTITSGTGPILFASEEISSVYKEIVYMSNDELSENRHIFTEIFNSIKYESDYNKKIEKSKQILEIYFNSRFSASNILYYFMPIFTLITEYKDIKKWLSVQSIFKELFIGEFVNSGSFDYAGTTSKIICNLLPSFTDEELLEIIKGIEENDQIKFSFTARNNVNAIINASRMVLSSDRFTKLKELYKD